jgi:hypothetical protein
MATPFSNKCEILGSLWINFKNDTAFSEFVTYNDIGLPLAYFVSEGFVTLAKEEGENFINETWDMFSEALGLDEDREYESLDEIMMENSGEE